MTIRTCIVDDEPLARERIRVLLAGEPDVEIVGKSGGGPAAVDVIRAVRPDLLFVDVQRSAPDGFGVLEALGTAVPRAVIFVTAYDQYALQAFAGHALDYVLKPFSSRRCHRALQRARAELLQRAGAGGGRAAPVAPRADPAPAAARAPRHQVGPARLVPPRRRDRLGPGRRQLRAPPCRSRVLYLLRETMKGIEAKLDPARFIRIHRSTIVNTDRIKELQPLFHGEYAVILRDGTRLTAGRGPENEIRRLIDASA